MVERQLETRLAAKISIALTAGMFSIVPVTYGAPTLDKVVSGGATVATNDKITNITSTTQNNVINWQDFSVAKDETVQFDNGAKQNNYLNLVTGGSTSEINGKINGGNNVYIVNPNGVIFGSESSVDVGNLYVSTRAVDDSTINGIKNGTNEMSDLVTSQPTALGGDVVNLGKINADTVKIEGVNITLLNSDDVKISDGSAVNTNVNMIAANRIDIGDNSGSSNSYAISAVSTNRHKGTGVYDENSLANIKNNLSGDYWLARDIDLKSSSYTPIGDDNGAFTGKFDGAFHTVSGLNVKNADIAKGYGGLFGYANGATIENVGVKDGSVEAFYAGGIVGRAENTTLKNVFNEGVTIKTTATKGPQNRQAGGIAGSATNTTISNAYNTGAILSKLGAGIVGLGGGTLKIENAYNDQRNNSNNISDNGILGGTNSGTNYITINNTYTTTSATHSSSAHVNNESHSKINVTADKNKLSDFSDLDGIGNTSETATTWRIYEGSSTPLLTAFLNAKGKYTVKYNYTQGDKVKGDTNGTDLELTYNNNNVDISGATYWSENGIQILNPTGINKSNKTYRDVMFEGDNNNNPTINKSAIFYGGQNGYNLVGGNLTITPREVDVDSILGNATIKKVYDGTTTVNADAIKSLFEGTETTTTGVLANDNTVAIDSSNLKGEFDNKNVGADKNVTLNGGLSIKNAAGYANYVIKGANSDGSASIDGKKIKGTIEQKKLTVKFADSFYGGGQKINKTYDGTASAAEAEGKDFTINPDDIIKDEQGSNEDVSIGIIGADKIAGSYVDANGDDTKKAGKDYKVKYSGIALTGNDAGNYILVDEQGNTIYSLKTDGVGEDVGKDTGGTLYGKGTIGKLDLANTGYSWFDDAGNKQEATRQYDGKTSYIDANGKLVKSDKMPAGDDLIFTVTEADFTTANDSTGTKTANVKDAKGLVYTITISGDDAENYTLNGKDLVNGSTDKVYGDGKITPRVLKLTTSDKVAEKTYDGNNNVYGTNNNTDLTLADGYLKYATDDDKYHLIENDPNGTTLKITGSYDTKDVNYSDGEVKNKNVSYTVAVVDSNGNASENYVLDDGGSTTKDYSGTGKINQREIDDISFADIDKTYDTKSGVLGVQANDKVKLDNTGNSWLVSGEDVNDVLDVSKINGKYGQKNGDDFTANADVARDENGAVTAKDVRYTGIKNSVINNNYKLKDGLDTAYGKGTINTLKITDKNDLNISTNPDKTITKEYDGNNLVADSGKDAADYIGNLTTTVGGQTVGLEYTVGDANDATYASKNSNNGTAQDVNYKLTVKKSGNYEIADDLLNDGKLDWTFANAGVITPKTATVSAAQKDINKVYDATKDVYGDINGNKTLLKDSDAVTIDGLVSGDSYKASAEYDDKNVGTDKNISYKITMDADTRGNYKLVDADGNDIKGNSDSFNGTGSLDKAKLTLSFDNVDKTFDNTTNVDKNNVHYTFNGLQGSDTATIKDGYNASYDSVNAGNRTIGYSDIELDDETAKNYDLVDKNGDITTDGTGGGTINKKQLTDSDINISFDNINKVYDTSNDVSYDHSGWTSQDNTKKDAADYIKNGASLGGVDLTLNGNYNIVDAKYNSAGVDASKADYTFKIDDDLFNNFDFSGLNNFKYDSDKKYILASTNAKITPKNVKASLTVNPSDISKTYDGTNKVTQDVSDKILLDGLFDGDNAALDTSAIDAVYSDKNVAYDADGNITTKDVTYNVKLTGGSSGNYNLIAADDDNNNGIGTSGIQLTGSGTITPMELTNIDFDFVKKEYDATTKIDNINAKTITGANGETIILDSSKISGEYGNWEQGAGNTTAVGANGTEQGKFTASSDVNFINPDGATEDDKAGNKALSYTGLKDALENATGSNGFEKGNYTIANDIYFTEDAGKGKITRRTLTEDQIKTNWATGQVEREYDGTANIDNAGDYLNMYVDLGNGSSYIPLKYKYKDAQIIDENGNAIADVGEHKVKLTVAGLEDKELNNFAMDKSWVDKFNKDYTSTSNIAKITPRVISANVVKNNGFDKIYDGTTAVKDAQGVHDNLVIDKGILDKDKGTVGLEWSADYSDKNVGDNKDISYTLKLTGNDKGNYTLDVNNKTKGSTEETDSNSYKTSGNITKRTLYIDWANGAPTNVDREYNGLNDTTADSNGTNKSQIDIVAGNDNDTGIISGDTVALDKNVIEANYVDANGNNDGSVARDDQGNVLNKDIHFGNFTLTGADSDNYDIVVRNGAGADNDKLVGTGKITPVTINVGLKDAVTKEYDGTTEIDANHNGLNNINVIDRNKILGNDDLGLEVTGSGYDDKNAGTDKKASYKLKWSNTNYELANNDTSDNTDVAVTGNGEATLTNSNAEITKRKLTGMTVNDASKTYDGTTDVIDAANNIRFDNVVKGDRINLIVNGTYDNANASSAEDSDSLIDHNVGYTIGLGTGGDSQNYELDTNDTTATGKGEIKRRELLVTADKKDVRVGDAMPSFTGRVDGWVAGEENSSDFIFKTADNADTTKPNTYPVYGWYTNEKGDDVTEGNYGLNYYIKQAPSNTTAFEVELVDPGREYHESLSPKTQFRPDNTAYNQAAMDYSNSRYVGYDTALEYQDKNGDVLGEIAIDGSSVAMNVPNSNEADIDKTSYGITGANVVNMDDAEAAGTAEIALSGDGEIVNLKAMPLK